MKRMMILFGMMLASCACMAGAEIVDGITWTYWATSGGGASVGIDSPAISKSTTGAIAIPSTLGGYPVTGIGNYAFKGCSRLTSVTIPEGVTSIGKYAFEDCIRLTNVPIPSSVTSIGYNAFSYCRGIGNGVVIVDNCVLTVNGSCPSSVVLPEGTRLISDGMFCGCSGLTSVTIPESMTIIGDCAFNYCGELMSFDVDNENPNYKSENGLLLTKDGATLIAGVNGDVAISKGVTHIGSSAFKGYSGLTSVTIPSGVTSISDYAFTRCSGLTNVTISEGVTSIGEHAFEGCSGLTNVTILSSVASIAANAFTGCTGIRTINIPASYNVATVFPDAYAAVTKLIIPDGTTTIEADAYKGCSSVTAVEVPASVTTVGSGAFQNCSSLKSVTFKGQAPACGDNVFTGTSADLVVYAGTGTSGWTQWNGRPLAFIDAGGGSEDQEVVEKAHLTVTNVVIHYVVNSVVPTKTYPATYDTGFVNIITEVKSGGAVSVPATWMVNYPDYVTKFGGDFTKSLMKPTGKHDAMGNPMCVWQDYVAGTDPTDEDDVFTASITMDDNGKVVVSYNPELNDDEKAKRQYTTYGKKSLTDKDWVVVPAGSEADYNFFKVTVEMP